MRVTLDHEQWEVSAATTLGEVLADLSERAHARTRIIIALAVDHRTITDRDLDAALLGESTARFTRLTATSQSMQDLVQSAQGSIHHYAEMVRTEGNMIAAAFRSGQTQVNTLDRWLGRLADYLELVEGPSQTPPAAGSARRLSAWVQDLLDARSAGDVVLMADLLEYEILPRLAE